MGMYIRAPINEGAPNRTLLASVVGKLEEQDYQKLGERMKELVAYHGKINMLIELSDFHGWTAGAAWEDFKFGLEYAEDIEKIAIVGENDWQEGMSIFIKPFTNAELQYFDKNNIQEAHDWVEDQEYSSS